MCYSDRRAALLVKWALRTGGHTWFSKRKALPKKCVSYWSYNTINVSLFFELSNKPINISPSPNSYLSNWLYHIQSVITNGWGVLKKSMRSIVYHQFRKELHIIKTQFCISSSRQLYTLRVMIYAYGDDIHAKAWWYTKPVGLDKKRGCKKSVDRKNGYT